jgi:hypothetical protein
MTTKRLLRARADVPGQGDLMANSFFEKRNGHPETLKKNLVILHFSYKLKVLTLPEFSLKFIKIAINSPNSAQSVPSFEKKFLTFLP